jgi:hypothetical protein
MMCASLVTEELDGFYSRVYPSQVTHCPVNISIPAPEKGTVHIGHKTHNGDFLQNYWNDFDYIMVVCAIHLPE